MLTPVDITNKVFKGGIGYDKKDVESFILELSTDYRELYSSNVELKDKVATLNESLQHYRSIEDSMQKALTLSEKTAEETVNAATDRARQINTEAELKAEALLSDAKEELQDTKDEIYRLQQQLALFKKQFTRILDNQKKMMDGEIVDIDLGADFEPSAGAFGGFSGGLSSEGGLGGGLGAGTYVGSSGDPGRERTNQEPAFDRGSLNMDPFGDAANGGGRFSKQTGGAYNSAKKKKAPQKPVDNVANGLNVKESQPAKSTKVNRNVTAPQPTSNTVSQTPSHNVPPQTNTVSQTQTVSKEDVLEALKASSQQSTSAPEPEDAVVNGEVETRINESNMLDSEDNYNEGFDFIAEDDSANDDSEIVMNGEVENRINESNMLDSEDNYNDGFDFIAEETTTQFSYEPTEDDTYSGEVESKVNESNMLDSEDNYNDGFDFIVDEGFVEEEIPTILSSVNINNFNQTPTEDDVLVGDVEENVKQSNLIGNDDDTEEGFNFL